MPHHPMVKEATMAQVWWEGLGPMDGLSLKLSSSRSAEDMHMSPGSHRRGKLQASPTCFSVVVFFFYQPDHSGPPCLVP